MSFLRLGYLIGSIGYIPKSILDVGYGNGDFLLRCCDIIENCYGNDISSYPLPINVKFVQDITENFFEVITFFDSLEHFNNIDFVKDLKCDYVFISLPWCHNHSDSWFENWKHTREYEHIYHINDESLKLFMKECGFECINITNFEDSIRTPINNDKNILSGIFKNLKK
jgi:SAM-dependent methyltransferase